MMSVLHQMTSDHNRSELGIHDNSNEPSSSKLVPKVVPLAVKTATSRQELELLFHHQIAMLRTTGHIPFQTLAEHHQIHKLLTRVLRNILVIFARNSQVILFSIHNDEMEIHPVSSSKTALRRADVVRIGRLESHLSARVLNNVYVIYSRAPEEHLSSVEDLLGDKELDTYGAINKDLYQAFPMSTSMSHQ
ncbi:hypothetical protein Tco_0803541 [Tanacetum coccineum]|uniref:Uncharacterized protein n=1 Tax=Tanacetum coccineum TaxID=301880 RepID=A0ABQ5A6A5_9ASTR